MSWSGARGAELVHREELRLSLQITCSRPMAPENLHLTFMPFCRVRTSWAVRAEPSREGDPDAFTSAPVCAGVSPPGSGALRALCLGSGPHVRGCGGDGPTISPA